MSQFQNIFVYVPPGKETSYALSQAVEIAEQSKGTITVITMIDTMSSWTSGDLRVKEWADDFVEDVRDSQEKLIAPYAKRSCHFRIVTMQSENELKLIRYSIDSDCDLFVKDIGKDTDGVHDQLSSLGLRFLRKCPCPVWIVRKSDGASNVGVAIAPDDTKEGIRFNKKLLKLAGLFGDEYSLHVIEAWDVMRSKHFLGTSFFKKMPDISEAYHEKLKLGLEALLSGHPVAQNKDSIHLVRGGPEEVIKKIVEQEGIQNLVLGCVTRSGLAGHFLGNTAERIIKHVPCSVIALKPGGWVSPLEMDTED